MRTTSYRIAGMWVYIIQSYVCRRTPYSACLQVYAIQRSVCGHVPYIALVCRCIPYHTELCLQAYTVQCLSAGVCHTALCLRACTIHRACLLVYTISYRAMSASVHRTVLVCRCMPYSAMSAGMYRTSCLSVGVYHIIRSYVCRRVPYHTELCLQAYTVQCLLVCRCMPYSAMSAGMYHTSRLSIGVYHIVQSYVCKRIPYSACLQAYAIQRYVCGHVPSIALVCRCIPYRTELRLQAYTMQCLSAGVCHTALCLRACAIHRTCL
jgi:hypothetical protein